MAEIESKRKKGEESLYFLRDKLYPDLYAALIKLIDHIIKTDEIRKHQERLKKKKVFDKLEQRKIDKERLKAELGSEYESSDEESIDFEELGLGKEELNQILAERPDRKKESDDEEDETDRQTKAKHDKPNIFEEKLGQIQEDDENAEQEEDDDKHIENQRQQIMEQLKRQREEDAFNPLKFLATKLKEIADQRKAQKSQNK